MQGVVDGVIVVDAGVDGLGGGGVEGGRVVGGEVAVLGDLAGPAGFSGRGFGGRFIFGDLGGFGGEWRGCRGFEAADGGYGFGGILVVAVFGAGVVVEDGLPLCWRGAVG